MQHISTHYILTRHFVQEDLPRIRYANPDLDIDVIKWRKEKNDHWRPELEVKFGSSFPASKWPLLSTDLPTDGGRVKIVDMDAKTSSTILKEVMSIAGGDPWKTHVEKATKAGTPIFPGEPLDDEQTKQASKKEGGKPLPNLWEFRKANPEKEKIAEQARKEWKAQKKKGEVEKRERTRTEVTSDTSVSELNSSISETPTSSHASTTEATS
jgi:small subunit ribosomal protein S25